MSLPYTGIVQFSPPRTGSTLIYNILKIILSDIDVCITPTHTFNYNPKHLYVVTMRHPYNSIMSLIFADVGGLRSDKNKITEHDIELYTDMYLREGGESMSNQDMKRKNILIMFYEEFRNNFENIFKCLEVFLKDNHLIKGHIDQDKKDIINSTLNIDSVYKICSKYKTFEEYDSSGWHGNHISKYKGDTNFRKLLTNKQISILQRNNILNKIISKFNYVDM